MCPEGWFTCKSGGITCIQNAFKCDCSFDCDDGSDETIGYAGCSTAVITQCAENNSGYILYILVHKKYYAYYAYYQ